MIKEIKRQLVPLREMQGIVSPSNKAKKDKRLKKGRGGWEGGESREKRYPTE